MKKIVRPSGRPRITSVKLVDLINGNEKDNLSVVIEKQKDLIKKIKHFLDENISDAYSHYLSIDDDAELDFLDRTPRWHQDIARSGCADELEMEIRKWEKGE